MKRFLSVITLASLAVPTAAVVAQLAGVPVSTAFSVEICLSVFVSAFALLLAVSEYSHRRSYVVKRSSGILLPAAEAFRPCDCHARVAAVQERQTAEMECSSACV
jgi:hypothetical protein